MKGNGKLSAGRVVAITPVEGPATAPPRVVSPDPEVTEKPDRRTFTAEYKLRILREVEDNPGQRGAILRREGLYSSHIAKWRDQRKRAEMQGLAPQKRGRKAKERHPLERRVTELEREKRKLEGQLKRAELIIEIQKKASELLGIHLNSEGLEESD